MPNVTPLRPGDPRRVGRYRLTGHLDDFAKIDTAQQEVFLAQRVDGAAVMAAFPGTGRADDAAVALAEGALVTSDSGLRQGEVIGGGAVNLLAEIVS